MFQISTVFLISLFWIDIILNIGHKKLVWNLKIMLMMKRIISKLKKIYHYISTCIPNWLKVLIYNKTAVDTLHVYFSEPFNSSWYKRKCKHSTVFIDATNWADIQCCPPRENESPVRNAFINNNDDNKTYKLAPFR